MQRATQRAHQTQQSRERQTPNHSTATDWQTLHYNVEREIQYTVYLIFPSIFLIYVHCYCCFICMQLGCKHFGSANVQIFVMPIMYLKTEYWENLKQNTSEWDLFMLGGSRGSLKRRDQSQYSRSETESWRERAIVFTGYVRLFFLLAVVNWIIFSSLLTYVNSCVTAAAAGLQFCLPLEDERTSHTHTDSPHRHSSLFLTLSNTHTNIMAESEKDTRNKTAATH